jgi:hypothetical protein
VGARADDHIGPGLDQLLCQRLLLGVRAGLRLRAPVHVHDHGVSRAPHLLDLAHELRRVNGRGNARLGRRGRPRVDQVVGDHLRRRDDRHPLSADRHPVGGEGLCRRAADADDGEAGLGGDGQVLRQALRPTVHTVVVGLGGHGDRGALESRDGRRGCVEDVRLALRFRARPVGHRCLDVHHLELGSVEELGDARAEGRRRVLGQALAHIAREVHVAPEAEGDGLPVAGPVRVERRVLREVLGGDDSMVGRDGLGRRARTAREEREIDQQEEDEGAAHCELAAPAHDPS